MNKPTGKPGSVRIIGGRWRGTRLQVPERPGLRPTSDRVRETLFNWLMPALPGAHVLDLFAGSGALGLEALSRGAADATLVERDAGLAGALRDSLGRLQGGEAGAVVQGDAQAWLRNAPARHFDIVFVDPPFAAGLWDAVAPGISACAAEGAWLYVESPADADIRPGPRWRLHREGQTRDVRYRLFRDAGNALDTLDGASASGP